MKKTLKAWLCSFLILFTLSACTTSNKIRFRKLENKISASQEFENSHSGFVIYDPEMEKIVFSKNGDAYFMPASNIKILTLYACIKTLGDSIPALRYIKKNDSLVFWGTADPTLLHPYFDSHKIVTFLKENFTKSLFFSNSNFNTPALGSGWAWDDYNDAYQAEISPLSLYGNILVAQVKEKKLEASPSYFLPKFKESVSTKNIKRQFFENTFEFNPELLAHENFKQEIPFKTSDSLSVALLSAAIDRPISIFNTALPDARQTIFSVSADTVYKRMMKVSDNHLAEHLLLLAGQTISDTISTQASISNLKQKPYFQSLAPFRWVDGSGLSRYNLIMPKTMVMILDKMWKEIPQKQLFALITGEEPSNVKFTKKTSFIFAKSGSMSGTYNLSGYLVTRTGKVYIFSFMNNNFLIPTSTIKNKTLDILNWIHNNF